MHVSFDIFYLKMKKIHDVWFADTGLQSRQTKLREQWEQSVVALMCEGLGKDKQVSEPSAWVWLSTQRRTSHLRVTWSLLLAQEWKSEKSWAIRAGLLLVESHQPDRSYLATIKHTAQVGCVCDTVSLKLMSNITRVSPLPPVSSHLYTRLILEDCT